MTKETYAAAANLFDAIVAARDRYHDDCDVDTEHDDEGAEDEEQEKLDGLLSDLEAWEDELATWLLDNRSTVGDLGGHEHLDNKDAVNA